MTPPPGYVVGAGGGGYQIIARPETFVATAAAFLGRKLGAIPDGRRLDVALSGGSTPGPVYEALAGGPHARWDRVRLFFADERAVPPEHADSNYRLVRKTLLDRLAVEPEVHRMPADVDDLERAATDYEAVLPDRLDILVLGLGSDGHTASLFPGDPMVSDPARKVVATIAPTGPRRRLSIAPRVIASARLVVILVTGERKTDAVRRTLFGHGPALECPGRLARRGVWIIGADALPGVRR